MSPPFRWQAGKVWQGTGNAVRLPPRSWWILASRPSAPWLLTGIPDATWPLSSCSTLAGPSVLPFQARAPSSTSAGITNKQTKKLSARRWEGPFYPQQAHAIQHGSPFSESQQEWQRLDLTLQHTHMRTHTHPRPSPVTFLSPHCYRHWDSESYICALFRKPFPWPEGPSRP